MTLSKEIAWWTRQAFRSDTDAALIAFGVATGLKLARADYGASDAAVPRPHWTDDARLIAAAPDMLAALQEAELWLHTADPAETPMMWAAHEKVRAAIALATAHDSADRGHA
jgi:hypothetical protein